MREQGGSGKPVVRQTLVVECCSVCRCQGECHGLSSVYHICFSTYLLHFLFHMSSISGLPHFRIAFGVTALLIEDLLHTMMGGMCRKPS
jgi:hypothetical protein